MKQHSKTQARALLILSVASASLVACGKGRSNNPFRSLATANKAPELQGSYESDCRSAKEGWLRAKSVLKGNLKPSTFPSSERTFVSFKGDAATIKEVHYLGSKCDGGEAFAFVERGSYRVGDKDKNEKNNAGRYLDIEMKRVDAKVLSDEGAAFANSVSLCGFDGWKASDGEREVTEEANKGNCAGKTPRRTIANVYQVDNQSLALGYTGDRARMSEERPTTLDKSNVFHRKGH